MKKTNVLMIANLIEEFLFESGFRDIGIPASTPRILRRGEQYTMFTCDSYRGNIRVGLMAGYFNKLAIDMISKIKKVYEMGTIDNLPNIASYIGENVDYSANYIDHFEGLLDVCSAEIATSGQIFLPKNAEYAINKISKAFLIFPKIFSEFIPRLDEDIPCRKMPRYLYNSPSLPTLICCFARAVELGLGTQQFEYTSNLLEEFGSFHFPKCEKIIPILKEYI